MVRDRTRRRHIGAAADHAAGQRTIVRPGRAAIALGVIFLGAAVLKLVLLLTSQHAEDADEAVVGLMALHVLKLGEHPLFLWGQAYDIGSGVLAHLAAAVFWVGGVSTLSLKLAALLVWLAMAACLTGVLWRWRGRRAALLGAALVLFSPTGVEWAVKARGGHMAAALATIVVVALGLRVSAVRTPQEAWRRRLLSAAIGVAAPIAVWLHPIALPAVGVAVLMIAVALMRLRDWPALALLALLAVAASGLPALALPASSSWSWQAFAGTGARVDLALLFTRVLPGVFTPELDWAIPPQPAWFVAVGWLWLASFVTAGLALTLSVIRCGTSTVGGGQSLFLLAAAGAACGAMFMADASFVSPRTLLPLYPLACMVIAVAAEEWLARSRRAAVAVVTLAASGVMVHIASIGPPTIHGAGEQERRMAGDVVPRMLSDLERHHVRHVFSMSPMLQWNLMFESREQVAARWTPAQERWQPYAERVNAAFVRRERCALLIRTGGGEQMTALQTQFAPDQLTVINQRYALLYDPPRQIVTSMFERTGGWPSSE